MLTQITQDRVICGFLLLLPGLGVHPARRAGDTPVSSQISDYAVVITPSIILIFQTVLQTETLVLQMGTLRFCR